VAVPCILILSKSFYFTNVCTIQGVSRLVDITAGGVFLDLCDKKISYKHVSGFGRLRSFGHFFNSRTRRRVNRVLRNQLAGDVLSLVVHRLRKLQTSNSRSSQLER